MEFEWWEAKRIAVLRDRGLDFLDARRLFDGRDSYTVPSPRGGERRWVSVGELDQVMVAVVWTRRGARPPLAGEGETHRTHAGVRHLT
jgi:uncharacterized DUF497 family protein